MNSSRSRATVATLVFGIVGVAILLALGTWQMRRLAWKEGVIAELETRLAADPAPLPEAPDEARDEYLRVALSGRFPGGEGSEAHVLSTLKPYGPGFRIISAFETDDGRRILIDRGFVPESLKNAPRPAERASFTATLLWPDDSDAFTPDPDLERNFWFARDVGKLARALDAEPVLAVAETGPAGREWPRPQPIDVHVRNDHLGYALTWFGLAAVWAGMTAALLLRVRRGGGF